MNRKHFNLSASAIFIIVLVTLTSLIIKNLLIIKNQTLVTDVPDSFKNDEETFMCFSNLAFHDYSCYEDLMQLELTALKDIYDNKLPLLNTPDDSSSLCYTIDTKKGYILVITSTISYLVYGMEYPLLNWNLTPTTYNSKNEARDEILKKWSKIPLSKEEAKSIYLDERGGEWGLEDRLRLYFTVVTNFGIEPIVPLPIDGYPHNPDYLGQIYFELFVNDPKMTKWYDLIEQTIYTLFPA